VRHTTVRIAVALLMALTVGCYRSHLRGESEDGEGGLRDGGSVASRDGDGIDRIDTGLDPHGDAGMRGDGGSRVDAGPVLPAEPDPDLGPDSRPSDYPDADDWDDVPPLAEGDPCCTMDDPILIASRDTGMVLMREPVIAWGPDRWGLMATRASVAPRFLEDPHPVIFQLERDGHPGGDPVVLDQPSAEPGDTGVLHWAEGRWAVGLTTGAIGGDVRSWSARLFDADFTPASEWHTSIDAGVFLYDLARVTHGDQWVGIGHDHTVLNVLAFTPTGGESSAVRAVAAGRVLDTVGLRSRAAVLVNGLTLVTPNVLTVIGPAPALDVLGSVSLSSGGGARVSVAAVRDLVLAAVASERVVTMEVVDPFAGVVLGAPQELGRLTTDASFSSTALDAAGSSKLGMAGVCYGEQVDAADRSAATHIDFRIAGTDGAPRGTSVRIVEGPFRSAFTSCTVGTDDDGFLVAWWNGAELWVRRIHVRR
jgi:hypothetical protein